MVSIYEFIQSNHDDFWLNVLAGIPFLLFDIAIITLLLPITLRWWDERAWRETRLIAIQRLLSVYGDPLPRERNEGADTDPLQVLANLSDGSHNLWARDCLLTMVRKLDAYSSRIDMELQSALHIFDAPLAKDILTLHYLVKAQIDRSREIAISLTERLEWEFSPGSEVGEAYGMDFTNLATVETKLERGCITLGCAIQRLAVVYAPDRAALDLILRSKPTMQLVACAKLCAVAAYIDRSWAYENARPYGIEQANALFRQLVAEIEVSPRVKLFASTPIDRIMGRAYSKLG